MPNKKLPVTAIKAQLESDKKDAAANLLKKTSEAEKTRKKMKSMGGSRGYATVETDRADIAATKAQSAYSKAVRTTAGDNKYVNPINGPIAKSAKSK